MAWGADTLGLLERDEELQGLQAAAAAAAAGTGALVVLDTAAGLGATSLLARAAGAAAADGLAVLRAAPRRLDRAAPWALLRRLFAGALRDATPAERERLMSGPARVAVELLAGDDAVAEGPAVEYGVLWLVTDLAERAPLLLLVDDAQWADAPSLRALAYLAERLEDLAAALVVVRRPDERGGDELGTAALLERLAGDPFAVVLHLDPLSPDATAALVRRALPGAQDGFCAGCRDATGGNPALLALLLDQARRAHIEPVDAQAGRAVALGGRRVAETLLSRVHEHGPDAAALALAIAVLGDDHPLRTVADVAGLAVTDAERVADGLLAARLLRRRGDRVAFIHPLLRSAIYDALPAPEQSAAHARAAHVLFEAGAAPAAVGAHLLSVDPSGDPWVVARLREAAAAASRRGAPDAAHRDLVRALREPPRSAEAADLRLEAARRAMQGGLWARAVALLSGHVEAAPTADGRARAAWTLAEALVQRGAWATAVAVADRALAAPGDADPELVVRLELAAIDALRLAPDRSGEVRARLTRLADGLGDHARPGEAEKVVLANRAWEASSADGTAAEAVDLARRALAGDALEDAQEAIGPAWFLAIRALIVADELDEAVTRLTAAMELQRERGMMLRFAIATFYRADAELRRGHLATAEADARLAMSLVGDGHQTQHACIESVVNALAARGRPDEALALLEDLGLTGRLPEESPSIGLHLARGRMRVARGELEAGVEDMLRCGALRLAQGRTNPAWNGWRSEAAHALVRLGDLDRARALADEELALARAWGSPRAVGVALRAAAAVTGERALLEEAAALLAGSRAQLVEARVLLDLGTDVARTDPAAAREPLRRALDLAARCGADGLAEVARETLVAAGGRPRRAALAGVAALTPAERRVCEMAAEGLTDRETAQALFLTVKTVEDHLRAAYRKLGVSGRGELRGALAEPAA